MSEAITEGGAEGADANLETAATNAESAAVENVFSGIVNPEIASEASATPEAGEASAEVAEGSEATEAQATNDAPAKSLDDYMPAQESWGKLDELDQELANTFRGIAYEQGMSEEMAQSVIVKMLDYTRKVEKDIETQRYEMAREQSRALQAEYGMRFKSTQELVVNTVTNLANEAGLTDMSVFDIPEVANNPTIFKLFAHIGRKLSEGGFAVAKAPSMVNAQQEFDAITSDPSNAYYAAYHDPSHPEHQKANERVNLLLERTMRGF